MTHTDWYIDWYTDWYCVSFEAEYTESGLFLSDASPLEANERATVNT